MTDAANRWGPNGGTNHIEAEGGGLINGSDRVVVASCSQTANGIFTIRYDERRGRTMLHIILSSVGLS